MCEGTQRNGEISMENATTIVESMEKMLIPWQQNEKVNGMQAIHRLTNIDK